MHPATAVPAQRRASGDLTADGQGIESLRILHAHQNLTAYLDGA